MNAVDELQEAFNACLAVPADDLRSSAEQNITRFIEAARKLEVDFKACVNRCLKELGERQIGQIICFGLGSFHDGVDNVSKYQLALLVLLHEYLLDQGSPLSSEIEIYDPSFEQLDKDTLMTFTRPQFNLIPNNEYCTRKLEVSDANICCLFYMPHLDKFLYNNLLGANWKIDNLSQLIILGNSFTEMIDNENPSNCRSELHFMNLLVNNFEKNEKIPIKLKGKSKVDCHHSRDREAPTALVELHLDDSTFEHHDVFNSLAFHFLNEAFILSDGSAKIQQNSLPDWTYVNSCFMDG